MYDGNLFDWSECETDLDIIDEVCSGLRYLKNDNHGLTFVASIIQEAGFSFEAIKKRMEEIDGMTYEVAESWHETEISEQSDPSKQ